MLRCEKREDIRLTGSVCGIDSRMISVGRECTAFLGSRPVISAWQNL